MPTESRCQQLLWLWENETNDEETQEWRGELNAEEQALVEQWDYGFFDGIRKMYQDLQSRKTKGGLETSNGMY